ncbi:ExeM/NucH family extracellular endonuclease [uncultured Limimaricola sp.]|uniref:ExeM/NucH family extracellular endonuclease n=1 Tax=uncultured Limimaricola sp. TaxID=2211667 RepID=UPI0030FC652F
MSEQTLLAWWSFNNSDNDGDLLNLTNDDENARSQFGFMLDNNRFDDGFYDPAGPMSGITPQLPGIEALFPVASAGAGALIGAPDPGDHDVPDASTYGAHLDLTGLAGDNFATSSSNNWGSFGGTDLNRPDGTFGGGSLTVTGSGNNDAYFDIRADLTDWSNVDITWANRGTSTGFDSRIVSVSTDGGVTFTEIFTDSGDLTSTWTTETADAGTLLDGASDAIIRFTLDGATSTSGNNRFDNIQLTGTTIGTPPPTEPEPEAAELVLISTIQGTPDTQVVNRFGDAGSSPLDGEEVRIEGIVTATFPDLHGFFVQEEAADSDGDLRSSEGIFVYAPGGFTVAEGYTVSVTGTVGENYGMTQISAEGRGATIEIIDAGNGLGLIDVPVLNRADYGGNEDLTALEQFEGMKISFEQDMVVSEYFELARYGQVTLYEGARPYQYTQLNAPDAAGYEAYLEDLATRRIILDDGNNTQNAATPDGKIFYPQPDGFSTGTQGEDFFRGGDVITDLTGVLHWSYAGQSGTDAWRLRPTDADPAEFTLVNERTDAPEDVGGSLKAASFNVLNYFTTLDDGSSTTATGLSPRGANSTAELERQTDKIVDALAKLDAQVVGLLEIENDDGAATAVLVEALNARVGADTYAYVDTGLIGTDAIKVALIYDQTKVRPVGDYAILDESVDARFRDGANRPALAQTFEEIETTGTFTAAVNHLKSKGSIFEGDASNGDGSGNNDQIRTDAAAALVDWLASDPTASGDADQLILGDLNSYAMEDPITAIRQGADDTAGTADDFVDLLAAHAGDAAYSYLFDGQLGTLDYALANTGLALQVTGATAWHINADEVPLFDYNDDVRDPGERSFEEEPSGNDLYEPNAYRASDHDPILVGLDLAPTFNIVAGGSDKNDRLSGGDGRDLIASGAGRLDKVTGGAGADRFVFGAETSNGVREREMIMDYEVGLDVIDLGGARIAGAREAGNHLKIVLAGDEDEIFVKFVDDLADITFINEGDMAFV